MGLAFLAVAASAAASPLQRDLQLASTYWHAEQPDLSAPCSPETVTPSNNPPTTTPPPAGYTLLAATAIGSCDITVTTRVWRILNSSRNGIDQQIVCTLIAHEEGHTLGWADNAALPLMRENVAADDDPLCRRAYDQPLASADRWWLTVHAVSGVGDAALV